MHGTYVKMSPQKNCFAGYGVMLPAKCANSDCVYKRLAWERNKDEHL
jgi:hypothetical protein